MIIYLLTSAKVSLKSPKPGANFVSTVIALHSGLILSRQCEMRPLVAPLSANICHVLDIIIFNCWTFVLQTTNNNYAIVD